MGMLDQDSIEKRSVGGGQFVASSRTIRSFSRAFEEGRLKDSDTARQRQQTCLLAQLSWLVVPIEVGFAQNRNYLNWSFT